MPPRRSARVAAAAEAAANAAFPQLPCGLALRIFAALPADARLRCCEVSRGWRATASTPELWRRLDLSPESGGLSAPASPALLRAAVAKARGTLESLVGQMSSKELIRVARANRGLAVVRGAIIVSLEDVETLSRLTPQLRELRANVVAFAYEVAPMLRCEGVFAPLRMHKLDLLNPTTPQLLRLRPALVDAALQPSLAEVSWVAMPPPDAMTVATPAAMGVLTDTYVARRLSSLDLSKVSLQREAVPVLGRMVRDGALTTLSLDACTGAFPDAATVASLADAVRDNRTLKTLCLADVDLWATPALGAQLLDALTGHPTLRDLCLFMNDASRVADVAGAALGRLVAADAPALVELNLAGWFLGDAGLVPMLQALPGNSHMLHLCILDNDMSAAFARTRLLPAVRANTSLRVLRTSRKNDAAVKEALAILAQR